MSAEGGPDAESGRARLADRIGRTLLTTGLLRAALVHRSYVAENAGELSNERLEFLGDAVLGLIVTDYLVRKYPDLPEGDLSRIRAEVVSASALAPVAAEIGVGDALLLGRGEELSGGRQKTSILADAMEALIAAAYLSSGIESTSNFVLSLLEDVIGEVAEREELGDPKNRLQELATRLDLEAPQYELREEGPDHARRYFAVVRVGEYVVAGEGDSKRRAEQSAATAALAAIGASVSGNA
ncbi:MAG: ribonuclease III [Acidimicrobiales bacterium]